MTHDVSCAGTDSPGNAHADAATHSCDVPESASTQKCQCQTPRARRPRRIGRTMQAIATYAAAIAAVASAVAAGVTLNFAYTESDRYGRFYSIREMKDFETEIAELGNPSDCTKFLNSIDSPEALRSILFPGVEAVTLAVTKVEHSSYLLCLTGLGFGVDKASNGGEEVSDGGANSNGVVLKVNPSTARILRSFVFKLLNVHDSLALFSNSGVADSETLDDFVNHHVYKDKALTLLLDNICKYANVPLEQHYASTVTGINSHRDEKICN